jgi:hypothetical protein
MHTCDPPYEALESWLDGWFNTTLGYTHLLLEAKQPTPPDLSDSLRPYFESAHADARRVFHKYAKIELHPDADGGDADTQYPLSLPIVDPDFRTMN